MVFDPVEWAEIAEDNQRLRCFLPEVVLSGPGLFSEVVDLHPVAIIVAVLVFGGIWGFWGVFFAIPLATLVQAVLKAWPTPSNAEHAREHAPEDERLEA